MKWVMDKALLGHHMYVCMGIVWFIQAAVKKNKIKNPNTPLLRLLGITVAVRIHPVYYL